MKTVKIKKKALLTNRTQEMPSKHIDEKAWKKMQELTVKTVIATQRPIRETDILHYLIKKGLESAKQEELNELRKESPKVTPRLTRAKHNQREYTSGETLN